MNDEVLHGFETSICNVWTPECSKACSISEMSMSLGAQRRPLPDGNARFSDKSISVSEENFEAIREQESLPAILHSMCELESRKYVVMHSTIPSTKQVIHTISGHEFQVNESDFGQSMMNTSHYIRIRTYL